LLSRQSKQSRPSAPPLFLTGPVQTLRTAKLYVALFLMDLLCDAGLVPLRYFGLLSLPMLLLVPLSPA
jgi:hypothetical protein